jgi:hypothetical protein
MPQGRVTNYDHTVGDPVEMDEAITLLSPFDTPLLGSYGADGRTTLSSDTCSQKKIEWMDEVLLAPRDTLGEALDDTETGVDIDTANAFGVGDVILIDAEYMRVTAVNAAGTTLTVTRGYNSSTAASHSDNAVVVGVGLALAEGSDPEIFRSVDRVARNNYTQIFGPHQVSMSGTEIVIPKYGVASEWDHQVAKKVKEVAISIEQALLYGKVQEDTSGEIRTMGGFIDFITTNVDSSTTTITEAKILDQMQAVFDLGGSVDRLVMGSKTKRVCSAFASSITVNVNRDERTRGQVVDMFQSDFGQAGLHLNRWCRTADLFGFSRDQATIKTLRPLQIERLAKTGDSEKCQILAEKTLQFEAQRNAFRFSALT